MAVTGTVPIHRTAAMRRAAGRVFAELWRRRRIWTGIAALAGVAAAALATEPTIWEARAWPLRLVLYGCQAAFTLRLGLRLVIATAAGDRAGGGRTGLVMDLVAAAAVPLAFAAGLREPAAWIAATVWTLQIGTAPEGLALLARVVRLEARPLAAVGALFVTVLMAAAVGAFLAEHAAQPTAFGSLPAALWWAVATVTTTGYGDVVPHTAAGRMLAALVMVAGLAVFGLATGILATGFAAEARRRDFLHSWALVAQVPLFRTLSAAGVAEIAGALRRLDVAEGAVIVRRGRTGESMYFIVAGEVEVRLHPTPVRMAEGAFFGEMALLGAGVRNATIVATRPTTLLVLDVADFRRLAARHADLAAAVEEEARRRADARKLESDA